MSRVGDRARRHNIYVARDRMKRRKTSFRNREKIYALQHPRHLCDPLTGRFPYTIRAPERFTIADDLCRRALLDFLEKICQVLLVKRRSVYIDFSPTTKMVADGTLVFYAVISRLNERIVPENRVRIRCSYPQNPLVEQVLQHVSIFEALQKRERTVVTDDTVRHWNSSTGTQVLGEMAQPVHDFFQDSGASESKSARLYAAITEAMTNSNQHAYQDAKSLRLWGRDVDARWWMFSQELNGILMVTFYDMGMGITASLRSGRQWSVGLVDYLLGFLGRGNRDEAYIEVSFALGKSVTGEKNRGKGMPELKDVLKQHGRGFLLVQSGKGFYHYNAASDVVTMGNFGRSIRGTMISWNIPVEDHD